MYIVKCIQILQFYARVVVELELWYVQHPLYIYIPIYVAASCTTRLARSRSPIIVQHSLLCTICTYTRVWACKHVPTYICRTSVAIYCMYKYNYMYIVNLVMSELNPPLLSARGGRTR